LPTCRGPLPLKAFKDDVVSGHERVAIDGGPLDACANHEKGDRSQTPGDRSSGFSAAETNETKKSLGAKRLSATSSLQWAFHRVTLYSIEMRHVRVLFLILTLLLPQAHACSSFWVLPDGRECSTCATESCATGAPLACKEVSSVDQNRPRDCHSCCTLTTCQEHSPVVAATSTAPVVPVATLVSQPEISTFELLSNEPRTVHIQIERGFPNAPPGSCSSRAPPLHLI